MKRIDGAKYLPGGVEDRVDVDDYRDTRAIQPLY
jgi:hypothetical protein